MRTRNNRVQVRLDEDELAYFLYCVEQTGLSQEAYLRQIISNRIPRLREERKLDRDIVSQLYNIGNNLNQIARYAHVKKALNVERYDEAVADFKKIMTEFLSRE